MSVTTIARRYAVALADVAIARNQVEQLESEVRAFAEMLAGNQELYEVFASPIISQDDKGRVLKAIIDRTRPSQITANLLKTLLHHYRLQHLEVVYEQFRREINERRGLVLAEVTTAAPVGTAEQGVLGQRLQQMIGKQVEIQFKTDPSLIGGVVTRVGSVIYDGSVRTQLQGIRQRLKEGDHRKSEVLSPRSEV